MFLNYCAGKSIQIKTQIVAHFLGWIQNLAIAEKIGFVEHFGAPVHTLDRSFHALDRSFQGLSTVRSEIVHKLYIKICCYSGLFLFEKL